MQITALFNTSVNNAPSGYVGAVQAAISAIDALINNSISLTINFGWNEVNGQALSAGVLGENIANGAFYTYSQVLGGLTRSAVSADDQAALATLTSANPTGSGKFFVTTPEAMAFGLRSGTSVPAGSVGLNGAYAYAFDPANRAVRGAYDAIGVLEHEITEILGRSGSLGSFDGANTFTPLDLFRYSAPGVRALAPGPGFFSVDGQTMLLAYNDPTNGGDASDWASSVAGDAFGSGYTGRTSVISSADLKELDILGYTLQGAAAPASPPLLIATSPAASASGIALGAPIVLSFNEAVRLGSGQLQIHAAGTGAVLQSISITDTAQVSLSAATITVRPSAGLPAGASVYVTLDPGAVTDLSGTPYAGFPSSSSVAFSDMSASAAVGGWISNVLQVAPTDPSVAALYNQVTTAVANGTSTVAQAIHTVNQAGSGATSVALLSYQFFTGATPTAAGLNYLVSPTGPNPTNLNSAYYQPFNETNRYINFAVNLGKAGAGATAFAAHYGALSVADATSQTYAQIFGVVPTAAKVDALLHTLVSTAGQSLTRLDYLTTYGGDGPSGIGTKAAVAGWLLSEAVHGGVGTYATAELAYLSDLAQGRAPFHIDLVGVYHGTPYTGG